MGKITKVEIQKNNKKRSNLYIDNNYYCSLDNDTVSKFSIKEGKELTEEFIESLQLENEKQVALNKSVDYLGKGLKTEKQMREYLKGKGYLKVVIDYVIETLARYKYINDEYYAKIFIEVYKKSKGKIYIKNKLKQKGISEEVIEAQLIEIGDQQEEAYNEIKKHLRNKEPEPIVINKGLRHLLQKGFTYSDAESAVRRYKEEWTK